MEEANKEQFDGNGCSNPEEERAPQEKESFSFFEGEFSGVEGEIDFASTCPHGRPIFSEIDYPHLERLFKRR